MTLIRNFFQLVFIFSILSTNNLIWAQAYPNKPVRLIVPQSAGGSSDAAARIIALKLSEVWKQNVVVETRPGAGGNIGTDLVAKAPKDGYTLLMTYEGSYAINQWLYGTLPFDSVKDFVTIASISTVPFLIVVAAGSRFKNLQEYIEAAKLGDGKLNFASAGNGTVNHLAGEMFKMQARVNIQHIPYKGITPGVTDLLGGQVDSAFTSIPSVSQFINNGKLRALAVTSAKRSEALPNVPTIHESGLPGFDINTWYGILGPSGLSDVIVKKINADINEILKQKDTKDRLAAIGFEILISTPEEFANFAQKDIQKWEKVVKSSAAKLD
jgi:tripartite-type tricarboxylate transporter receptor subunit TctC